jgi:cobalt/nickel transport system permease protein
MHISDGVLSSEVLLISSAISAGCVAVGVARLDDEKIPRVALLAAVFFISSLIRIPVGHSSAHLVLIGIMGMTLGWCVFPALAVALLLQAALFGHGGVVALGANIAVIGAPALACRGLLLAGARFNTHSGAIAFTGAVCGGVGVVLGCAMFSLFMIASGVEFAGLAAIVSAAHIPLIIIEAIITSVIAASLYRLKPDALALTHSVEIPAP